MVSRASQHGATIARRNGAWILRPIARVSAQGCTVGGPPHAGMDCGGSRDGDESVVMLAYGPDHLGRRELRLADAWQEADTMKSVGRALRLLREAGAEAASGDSIG